MFTTEQRRRIGYLQRLCNKYGDFKVATSYKKIDGETYWTRHTSVLQSWESEEALFFLANANHRQILPCEIVIDLDENPTPEKLNKICDSLEEKHAHYKAYFTGSRGYHIHIIEPKMNQNINDKRKKEAIREWIIKEFGGDLHKKCEVMVALENTPHWKTGMKKSVVRCYPHE